MKKVLALGLAMFGALTLSGCDAIKDALNLERSYNYNDYRAMLADRDLSFTVTKCESEIDTDGEKETRSYTWDASEQEWQYKSSILGIEYTNSDSSLMLVPQVKSCQLASAMLEKDVDELFKFYAKKDSYRITASYKTDDEQIEMEAKFNGSGLATYARTKTTDLNSIKSVVKVQTYSYSE